MEAMSVQLVKRTLVPLKEGNPVKKGSKRTQDPLFAPKTANQVQKKRNSGMNVRKQAETVRNFKNNGTNVRVVSEADIGSTKGRKFGQKRLQVDTESAICAKNGQSSAEKEK